MKRQHGWIVGTAVIVAAVGGAATTASGTSISITMVPSATQVEVGETFTLQLVATIVGGGEQDLALAAWGMDLSFGGGLIEHDPLADVSVALPWNQFSDDGDGLGGWALPDFDAPPEGSGIALATLEFLATAEGVVQFGGSFDEFVEGFGLLDADGNYVEPTSTDFGQATVVIGQVVIPLPPAALMAGLGLLGVPVLARARQRIE